MGDLPSLTVIHDQLPELPDRTPYDSRRRNYLLPFHTPPGWHLVVEIDGVRTEEFDYYCSQLIINNPQPPIGSTVFITIEEDEEPDTTE